MTTKNVRGIKLIKDKSGKSRLVRVRPFMAGKKDRDAAREAKRWEKRGQRKTPPGEGGV